MSTAERFLIAMLIVFLLPYLVWRLGRTDHWAPLVVVQIVCGILLGPGVLGAVSPDSYRYIFTPEVMLTLNGRAGIELDVKQAGSMPFRVERNNLI